MIRQIQAIKQQIGILNDNPGSAAPAERWATFSKNMTAIETTVYTQFKEKPDRNALWDIQNFHEEMVQLIDEHTPQNETSASETPLLNRLLETLSFSEQKFQVPIDLKKLVPLVYEREVRNLIRQEEPAIVSNLKAKRVHPVLIDKISHGFHLLLSHPVCQMVYATYRYFLLFIPALLELSLSTMQKDWNLRIVRFFIQYNFNHMGVYNWWERETEQHLLGKDAMAELEHIYKLVNHIEHIDQKTALRYEYWRTPLKQQMLTYLDHRKDLLADKKRLSDELKKHKLILNIPIDEQNIHFNDAYEQGVYRAYGSKEKASEAYAHVIRGPEGEKISSHSLRKADKQKYYGAADRVTEKLQEQQDRIRQRYPLPIHKNRK